MKVFKDFTRGGQLALHNLRMIRQVLFWSIIFSLLIGFSFFVFKALQIPYFSWKAYVQVLFQKLKAGEFSRTNLPLEKALWRAFLQSLMLAASFLFLSASLLTLRGRKAKKKKFERGGQLVTPVALKRLLKKRRMASHLALDGLPLLKNGETSHMLITGTTGSGKTNCLHTLLPQIRHQKALIVDLTGDFVLLPQYRPHHHKLGLQGFRRRRAGGKHRKSLLWRQHHARWHQSQFHQTHSTPRPPHRDIHT